jgi:hypothetical protein
MGFLGGLITYGVVASGWLLFRSPTGADILRFTQAFFTMSGGFAPVVFSAKDLLLMIGATLVVSLFPALNERLSRRVGRISPFWIGLLRPAFYTSIVLAILLSRQETRAFVYLQF